MLVRSLLVPVAVALAALSAAADDPKPPKPVPAGTVAAKVEAVSGTTITLDDKHTVVVPGAAHPHLVPGHVTPPHMVGGAHPHMVPGHVTPPHVAGNTHARPQTKTVDQKYTFDLAADVTVQTTVTGKTGLQAGTTSDIHKGDSVRVTLGTVTDKGADGKTTTKTVATKIEVLTEHAAPAAGKKK
jgi:hypothetical protein